MKFLKQWAWPIVAGFIVASITVLIFEYINSFLFPLPEGLDWNDPVAVKAVTSALPWTAYILVFLGWAVGAFEGGCTTAWLASERQLRATQILASLLVLAGIADMLMIGFPPIFTGIGIVILGVSPFLGRSAMNAFETKKRASIAS